MLLSCVLSVQIRNTLGYFRMLRFNPGLTLIFSFFEPTFYCLQCSDLKLEIFVTAYRFGNSQHIQPSIFISFPSPKPLCLALCPIPSLSVILSLLKYWACIEKNLIIRFYQIYKNYGWSSLLRLCFLILIFILILAIEVIINWQNDRFYSRKALLDIFNIVSVILSIRNNLVVYGDVQLFRESVRFKSFCLLVVYFSRSQGQILNIFFNNYKIFIMFTLLYNKSCFTKLIFCCAQLFFTFVGSSCKVFFKILFIDQVCFLERRFLKNVSSILQSDIILSIIYELYYSALVLCQFISVQFVTQYRALQPCYINGNKVTCKHQYEICEQKLLGYVNFSKIFCFDELTPPPQNPLQITK
eukprot:TRINITY_DN436_c2_g1_i1.p1 TRINITY_DN436_c2_g1~~TRINITY_DN436_c2_g1_i1.p1  ORF type:complete len:356 (+),score=-37.03 TRINITY_DN436_c2_g1_i1:162-1229(+)